MYSDERRRKILGLVQTETNVTVEELASHFCISKSSIRRDLVELSRLGLLQRTYGGAVIPLAASTETSHSDRQVSHREEKDRIGKLTAQLVTAGETIFVDGGTTMERMVGYLPEKINFTVVTFGLNIIDRLLGRENIDVIAIGGNLNHRYQTFGGVLAYEAIQTYNMRFDRAFIATSGVSCAAGITNASFEQIQIKRKAIEVARQTVILADSSKLGVATAWLIAPVESIHVLVTGCEASCDEVECIRARGVSVHLA